MGKLKTKYIENKQLKELVFSQDRHKMNWLRGDYDYAGVFLPEELSCAVEQTRDGDVYRTRFCFTNTSDKPFFTNTDSIGIYFPLQDKYESSEVCISHRCNTHVFCGGDVSYIMALRMGGEAPHLGMCLTEGSLACYSIVRNPEKESNDRGAFILHPSPVELAPGESVYLAWTIFPHEGKADFQKKLLAFPRYVQVQADRYVLFQGERCRLTIYPAFAAKRVLVNEKSAAPVSAHVLVSDMVGAPASAHVPVNDMSAASAEKCALVNEKSAIPVSKCTLVNDDMPAVNEGQKIPEHQKTPQNGSFIFEWQADTCGEQVFRIDADGVRTLCRVMVMPKPAALAKKRCLFIAGHQQYRGDNKMLSGAYLIYDNEEQHIYYNHTNDYNAGRERIGMGLLMARYLQTAAGGTDEAGAFEKTQESNLSEAERNILKRSLDSFTAFLKRELVNTDTGEVCNDAGMDNGFSRLYNAPWYAAYFTELYRLDGDCENLRLACRILEDYYAKGGAHFYAIELPVCMLCGALVDAGLADELQRMKAHFLKHADTLAAQGLHYPASEVNYEQSIVAPAASIILQAYLISGEQRYLEAGEKQLHVLEQFNGTQPDYHLFETAIRHWDGYWFGKRELYGDTFPHYWSALTGIVYELYARAVRKSGEIYEAKTEASLRGVLPLFFPDGSASCAYVYPHRVNGERAEYFDPYANDQDWGLYFYLRHCAGV